MTPTAFPDRRRERGFALLLVLLIVPIAIVVVTELAYTASLEYIAAENVTDIGKIEYAIDGQLELTLAHLKYDRKQNEIDGEFDEWNTQDLRKRTDEDVQLNEQVFDEQGKFNLMRLVTGNEDSQKRARKMFVEILDMFRDGISAEREKGGDIDQGTAEDLTDRIVKYLKREGGSGQVPKPKTTPLNTPLLLDELSFADDGKLIPSLLVDVKVKDGVAPGLHRYLTVYGSGKINVNTAPLVVLKAEFTNLQDRETYPQEIIDRRRSSADATPTTGPSRPGPSTPPASAAGSSTASTQGNPFADVGALTDGSVQGLTQEILARNGIDPAVEFDVKSDVFGVRIEGATSRTQRSELYVLQRVKTDGFRFLLHQERIDRLLATGDDVNANQEGS
jgi:general secretion pathway protein K